MAFRFEQLNIWQVARKFANAIYATTKTFPRTELFGLSNQLRRAAISVLLNIAEGSIRRSDKEFIRFLRLALSSLAEVVTGLCLALDQGYITKEKFSIFYKDANSLAAQTNALIKRLKA